MKEFICIRGNNGPGTDNKVLTGELKHLGTSVMDVYTGSLSVESICKEVMEYLELKNISRNGKFSSWVGKKSDDFRIISLSDGSRWTLKYHDNNLRFVHLFPARNSKHTFRVKSNTLKSALLYNAVIGKDYISVDNLNKVRRILGLSPLKATSDTEAISDMIEILRGK